MFNTESIAFLQNALLLSSCPQHCTQFLKDRLNICPTYMYAKKINAAHISISETPSTEHISSETLQTVQK